MNDPTEVFPQRKKAKVEEPKEENLEVDPRWFPRHCYPRKLDGETVREYIIRCLSFEQGWRRVPKETRISKEYRPLAILHGIPDEHVDVEGDTEHNTDDDVYWKNAADMSTQMYRSGEYTQTSTRKKIESFLNPTEGRMVEVNNRRTEDMNYVIATRELEYFELHYIECCYPRMTDNETWHEYMCRCYFFEYEWELVCSNPRPFPQRFEALAIYEGIKVEPSNILPEVRMKQLAENQDFQSDEEFYAWSTRTAQEFMDTLAPLESKNVFAEDKNEIAESIARLALKAALRPYKELHIDNKSEDDIIQKTITILKSNKRAPDCLKWAHPDLFRYPREWYPAKNDNENDNQHMVRSLVFEKRFDLLDKTKEIPKEFRSLAWFLEYIDSRLSPDFCYPPRKENEEKHDYIRRCHQHEMGFFTWKNHKVHPISHYPRMILNGFNPEWKDELTRDMDEDEKEYWRNSIKAAYELREKRGINQENAEALARGAVERGLASLKETSVDEREEEELVQKAITIYKSNSRLPNDREFTHPSFFRCPRGVYPKMEGFEDEEEYMIRCLVMDKEFDLLDKTKPIPDQFRIMAEFLGYIDTRTWKEFCYPPRRRFEAKHDYLRRCNEFVNDYFSVEEGQSRPLSHHPLIIVYGDDPVWSDELTEGMDEEEIQYWKSSIAKAYELREEEEANSNDNDEEEDSGEENEQDNEDVRRKTEAYYVRYLLR